MKLVNTGTAGSITLVAYTVKEGSGTQYVRTNWAGPTVQPNATVLIDITTNGNVSFQTRMNYTVTLTTAKNNQLTYVLYF
jgi:hypothetical protein